MTASSSARSKGSAIVFICGLSSGLLSLEWGFLLLSKLGWISSVGSRTWVMSSDFDRMGFSSLIQVGMKSFGWQQFMDVEFRI